MKNRGFGYWISWFILAVAVIAVYKTFDSFGVIWNFFSTLFGILMPFVIGLAIAFLLYVPAKKLENLFIKRGNAFIQKRARSFSVLIVYLLVIALVAVLLTFALPALINNIISLISNLSGYYDNLVKFVKEISAPGSLFAQIDLPGILEGLQKNILSFNISGETVLNYAKSLMNITSSVLNIFLALVVSIYMLLGRESLLRGVKKFFSIFFSEHKLSVVSKYVYKSTKILYGFLYSQGLDALIMSCILTIGFFIVGAPAAPMLGIMVGIMNVIPYFGAIIGGCVTVLFILLSGNLGGAIFMGVYIIIMQQIDGNVIQPLIVKGSIGLKPIYVLLAITVGGGFFGVIGIFLGVPVFAILKMLLNDYLIDRKAGGTGKKITRFFDGLSKNKRKVYTVNREIPKKSSEETSE